MIFVTVGTHEQQFNRLIKEVDRLKGEGLIQDDVFIQTGFSDYEPVHCQWKNLISYDEMNRYMDEANIIITHGGPATFMGVISKGKRPIVVPRQEKFGEHVNDHQVEFVKKISSEYGLIIVEDVKKLLENLEIYYVYEQNVETHNQLFNKKFSMEINEIVGRDGR